MKLKLVLKGPERLMGAQIEKTLEHGSLVVGRSPTAGWVLPDPERIVSKAHCRIDRDFSGFVVTDTSTNGVMVDDRPLGYGVSRALSGGERLKLGDAIIEVQLDSASKAIPEIGASALPAHDSSRPPLGSAGPFGITEALVEAPQAPVEPEPMTAAAQPGGASQRILDDWWTQDTAQGSDVTSKPVDILPQEAGNASLPAASSTESEESSGGTVEFLVQSRADIDVMGLARAVEEAGRLLPETERRSFHERLRDLLARPGGQQV
ncbi:FHA domain-containing protein [Mesorhizobium sp. CAU 1741]|uniref:FHA domain-containing protein n=1 Tax=Mesorhizobium sp. CAU 1741 TaxID=3140366 RepID=UPI00325AE418